MAEKEIILKNVSKVYDNGVYAVRDINLEIQPGEKEVWSSSTVKSILCNEKYKGAVQ